MRGPGKHQKRLSAPSHWLLDKLSGSYAPKASAGPHKLRDCMPLIVFIRNRLKYALNGREMKAIVMQRLIKVDGKVRTDPTYPAGFMDVISIEKTGEHFRLVYDTKGRFTVHRITGEEAEYKLGKVKRVQLGKGGIPFLVTHDARTIRFPDPAIKVNDTVKIDLNRGPPKYMLSQITGGNPSKHGDRIIASDDETEDAEAPFIQKLFGILRIYYTLLELVRRVALGIVAGAYSDSWSFRTPTLSLLCMTSFQLFFLVLKKPFIKKRVQLVEIISVATEVGIFTTCLILLEREFSAWVEKGIGKFMLLLFLIGFSTQMFNEWIALYTQTIRLGPSFLSGLKMASIGFILIFFPRKLLKNIFKEFPLNRTGSGETGDASSSGGQRRTSGRSSSDTSDKSWMKRLRELAKASFSRDDTGAMKDPSSSQIRSGFGSGKRSGSSSVTSSADFKSKSKKLYNDLEEIFSSK